MSLANGITRRYANNFQAGATYTYTFFGHDNSPANVQKLVAACKKHLSGHNGEVFFAAGTLCEDLKREVNDTDWHVGLHIVFNLVTQKLGGSIRVDSTVGQGTRFTLVLPVVAPG